MQDNKKNHVDNCVVVYAFGWVASIGNLYPNEIKYIYVPDICFSTCFISFHVPDWLSLMILQLYSLFSFLQSTTQSYWNLPIILPDDKLWRYK